MDDKKEYALEILQFVFQIVREKFVWKRWWKHVKIYVSIV